MDALKTAIGYLPKISDIDSTGLGLPSGTLEKLLSIDKNEWREELKGIKIFFKQFKKDLPLQLWQEYEELSARLKANA